MYGAATEILILDYVENSLLAESERQLRKMRAANGDSIISKEKLTSLKPNEIAILPPRKNS